MLSTREQKKQFRALAKIAHDGYVVDKAIDDVISIPEDFITDKLTGKGLVTEFVVAKFWGKYVEDKILPKIPSFGKSPGSSASLTTRSSTPRSTRAGSTTRSTGCSAGWRTIRQIRTSRASPSRPRSAASPLRASAR